MRGIAFVWIITGFVIEVMNRINPQWPAIALLFVSGCAHYPYDVQDGKQFRPGQATQSDVQATLGAPNVKGTNAQAPGKEMWRYDWGESDERGGHEGRALIFLFEGEKLMGVLSLASYSAGALPTLWEPGPMPLALDLNVDWWRWK